MEDQPVTPPFARGDWVRVVGESAIGSERGFLGRVGRIYDDPAPDHDTWYIRVEFAPGAWDDEWSDEWDGYHDDALRHAGPPEELWPWILHEISR